MGWASFREDILSRQVSAKYGALKKGNTVPDNKDPSGTGLKNSGPIGEKMSKLEEFTMATARPLPVIILADVSGSMSVNGKIDILNDAVSEMITTFAEEDDTRAEIHVAVITFGGEGAKLHKPLESASSVSWESMAAVGHTPMGEAFTITKQLIEDRDVIPSRAYRPTIVLISDGAPTDDWQPPLSMLLSSDRASKAARFAMGIGEDANKETLQAFLGDNQTRVFEAHEAREIKKFFRWVTMSVTSRSRSANPNSVVIAEPTDFDDFDF